MPYLKAVLIFLHIVFGLLLLVISGALIQPHWPWVKWLKSWWFRRTLNILNVKVQVHGPALPSVPPQGRLIVANHVSWLDIPLIGALTQTAFLSKAEVARWPLIGWLAKGSGTLFIQRGSGDANQVGQRIRERIAQGHQVLVFPEGTTSDGNQIQRFHPKLFSACADGQTGVQPLVIRYGGDDAEQRAALPFIGEDEFASHLWRLLSFPAIHVDLTLLPVQSFTRQGLRETVQALQSNMAAVLDQYQCSMA